MTRQRTRPVLVGELAAVAALLVLYDRIRGLADVHRAAAIDHGGAILTIEHALHLRIEGVLNHWLSAQALLGRVSVDYYEYLHATVAMGLLAGCYVFRPHLYRAARNALLLVSAIGLAVYVLYPVAPPRLMPGSAYLDLVARAGFGAGHGGPISIDQYGAMPSLHLAWATWVALVGFALTKATWLRGILALHVALTAFVVVGTANHYVLDVVMGILLAFACVAIARSRTESLGATAPSAELAVPVPGFSHDSGRRDERQARGGSADH